MTSSLLVLAWMSLTVSASHIAHRGSRPEMLAFCAAQMACFAAGSAEAGSAESGAPVRGARTLRAAAAAAAALYMAVITYYGLS